MRTAKAKTSDHQQSTTLHHRRWEYDAENNKDISPSPSLAGAFVFMGPVQRCDCFGLECCVDID
jgi:hypothetical protein